MDALDASASLVEIGTKVTKVRKVKGHVQPLNPQRARPRQGVGRKAEGEEAGGEAGGEWVAFWSPQRINGNLRHADNV